MSDATLTLESFMLASFDRQYTEPVQFEDVGDFMTDVYAIRYLNKNSLVDRRDIIRVLNSLSNLLRNCVEYDVNEIFTGCLRLRRIKDTTYFAIVEY